jgi:hypothetical protein
VTGRTAPRHSARRPHGTAIVAALVLLALGGGLLAMAAVAADAGARAVALERAALLADGAAHRALGETVQGWDPANDELAIGAGRIVSVTTDPGAPWPLMTRVLIRRIDTTLFALAVDVHVGVAPADARRRATLIVQQSAADSGGASPSPRPIARWSSADLY